MAETVEEESVLSVRSNLPPISIEIAPNDIVIPGQRLCSCDSRIEPGKGTYVRQGSIFATLVGAANVTNLDEGKVCLTVMNNKNENMVPMLGGLVTGKVTQVTSRLCRLAIFSVGDSVFDTPFRGMLRKQDVRPTEKDKVELHKCFLPGDVVVCRVISVIDSQSYTVTTAENELGVILAKSEHGAEMVPISWREMQCPKTMIKEYRKVAKPNPKLMELLKSNYSKMNLES